MCRWRLSYVGEYVWPSTRDQQPYGPKQFQFFAVRSLGIGQEACQSTSQVGFSRFTMKWGMVIVGADYMGAKANINGWV